ncbi:MAG: EAL domain-containing protein [Actinobacteria bacterium]|nr:EAL domain-containing protein [Actinomycetota bacterium]
MTRRVPRALSQDAPPWWLVAAVGVAVALGYVALGALSRQTVVPEAGISLVWIPAGYAVGLVARVRPIYLLGVLPGVAVAEFAADLWIFGFSLVGTLLFVLANFVEQAFIGLISRVLGVSQLSTSKDMVGFSAFTAVAVIGTASLGAVASSVTFGTGFWPAWITWYFGAVTSILLIAPFIMVVGRVGSFRSIRAVDVVLVLLLLVAVLELLLAPEQTKTFNALIAALLLPLLTIIGVRTGIAVVALLAPIVTYCVALAIARGLGPVGDLARELPSAVALQSFVVLAAVTIYAAALIEQGRLSAVAHEREVRERLEHRMRHDPLTGLWNRYGVREWLERNPSDQRRVALLIDLDDFKRLNDLLGSDAGDEALTQIADRADSLFDAPAATARYGADEFLIVVDGPELSVSSIIARVQDRLLDPVTFQSSDYPLEASVGVAVAGSEEAMTSDEQLRRADLALNSARQAGGDTAVVFEADLDTALRAEAELRGEVSAALVDRRVEVWFQPVVDVRTGEVVGAEALARLIRSDGSMCEPADFIPVAETSGLILPLGEQVLARSLEMLNDTALVPGFTIAVNVSERELRSEGYVDRLLQRLAASHVPASRLTLEVTESVVIDDDGVIAGLLEDLREAGVNVAIDDFGTGYSSLNALRQLPANIVKIDRGFVAGITQNRQDAAVVRGVLAVARDLDKRVIVEGIETQAQAGLLQEWGCRFGQGFLYGRPEPGEASVLLRAR